MAVLGLDLMQLVLKPLSKGRTGLVLPMGVQIHSDSMGSNPGRVGDNRTGELTSLMHPVRGMDWEVC